MLILNHVHKHSHSLVFLYVLFTGKRLSNVKNFKCRSKDWRNMTCEFTEMDNYIPLSYELTYKLDHRNAPNRYQCPLKNDSKRGRFCDVYYDGVRDGNGERPKKVDFYKGDDSFHFTLVSRYSERTGLSGEKVEYFEIDHLASVVPSAPLALRTVAVEADNVTIKYEIPSQYQYSRIRFDYELTVKSEYDTNWKESNTNFTNVEPNVTELRIPLDYAFSDYDIRLKIKSHNAPNQKDMWSPYMSTRVKTLSKAPDRPPNSTFGAFYIHDDDNLTIYWQQLKKYEENGPEFHYNISGPYTPKELKHVSAEFSHLKLDWHSYMFNIWSANTNGTSSTPLAIYVPQKQDLLDVQISLIQTYNEDKYNLTWTCKGSELNLIDKFVIFSCDSRSGNPNTCDDQLEFVTIEKSSHSLMFPAEPKLIFAIAAYGKGRTTGMQWNECRANAPNCKFSHPE